MDTSGFNTTITLHSTDTRLATTVYLTLMSILGTFGNTLVIVSIVRMKKLCRLYYVLIANLNIVALFTSVCLIPSHIVNIINSGLVHSNTELCKILGYLNFTLTLEVLLNTSAITIERCVVVHQTTQYLTHHSNKRKHITVIVILWIVPAIVSTSGLPFIGYHPFMLDCFFVVSHDSFWYILFALSMPAAVSMLIILASYFLTLKKVRHSHRKVATLCILNKNGKDVNFKLPHVSNQNATDISINHASPSKINRDTDDNSMHGASEQLEPVSFNILKHDCNAESPSKPASSEVFSSTTKTCDDNVPCDITKHSNTNTSIYILKHTAVTGKEQTDVVSNEVPSLITEHVANNGLHDTTEHGSTEHGTTEHSEADTSIYVLEHTDTAGLSKAASSKISPSTRKHEPSKHSETYTSFHPGHNSYQAASNEVPPSIRKHGTTTHSSFHPGHNSYQAASNEVPPSIRKHGTTTHSSFHPDTVCHKSDEATSCEIFQTVPVICLRPCEEELPWPQESAKGSSQSNPSLSGFVVCQQHKLISHNDSDILPSPDFHKLAKPSIEVQSTNHPDTEDESTIANVSIMEKALSLELPKWSLLRSHNMLVSEKNITKKAIMSLPNNDKHSAIHKQHLNISNTGSVPSISSIISEANMKEREMNTEENNKMTKLVAVGQYTKHMRRELSLTVHLFPVFVIFCFMYLPICMIQAIHIYYPVSPNIWLTFSTLELSFSTLSWVLYGVLNKEFRRAYKSILCCP